MTVRWHVALSSVEINAAMVRPNGPVMRDLIVRSLRVQALAKRKAPADQGSLRQSITIQYRYMPKFGVIVPVAEIGSNLSYARAVHTGTGVYGPSGKPITPVRAATLVFTTKSGIVVHAKSVRGQRGVPYLRDALAAVVG